jgi:glutathione synthase/RimK-type ligase-like ATP-grasp enzyme
MKIALATCNQFAQSLHMQDNLELRASLQRYGYEVVLVPWQQKVDWSKYDCVLPRATWNYYETPNNFKAWLRQVSQQTLLLNPLTVLLWNMEKHLYQQVLRDADFPCIPTIVIPKATQLHGLDLLLNQAPWRKVVAKPSVGANSVHRSIFDLRDASERQQQCVDLFQRLEHETMLLQPYLDCVETDLERNYVFLNGSFSHVFSRDSITTRQANQPFHQPQVAPRSEELSLARSVVAWLTQRFGGLLYARVDIVGKYIMEVELIEPYLHLEYIGESGRSGSDALAEAIAMRLSSRLLVMHDGALCNGGLAVR